MRGAQRPAVNLTEQVSFPLALGAGTRPRSVSNRGSPRGPSQTTASSFPPGGCSRGSEWSRPMVRPRRTLLGSDSSVSDAEVRDRAGDSRDCQLSDAEIREISKKSNEVLAGLGPSIQWLHSYVTGDKMIASTSRPTSRGARARPPRRFPANRVSAVRRLVDPTALSEGRRRRSGAEIASRMALSTGISHPSIQAAAPSRSGRDASRGREAILQPVLLVRGDRHADRLAQRGGRPREPQRALGLRLRDRRAGEASRRRAMPRL